MLILASRKFINSSLEQHFHSKNRYKAKLDRFKFRATFEIKQYLSQWTIDQQYT